MPPAPTAPVASPADSTSALALVAAAVDRHDGKACRAAVTRLPTTFADPTEEDRVVSARAICEMTAGNCDGGLRAFVDRFPLPAAGAQVLADQYCPPGSDPVVRLRRLYLQTTRQRPDQLACAYYAPLARAARQSATADADKRTLATVFTAVARCLASHGQCEEARGIAGEANTLDPRLDATAELGRCRL
ncbi:MAG: hypothetical protein ABI867_40325 [Kofleriaceae bacterium]